MTDTTDIDLLPPDLAYRLPADAYAHLVRTLSSLSKTSRESRETKTETQSRQPERRPESPARKAMLDQAMFGRRGPKWDRPMFFPTSGPPKPPNPPKTPALRHSATG